MGSLSRAQLVRWLKTIDITGKAVLDCGSGPPSKWARNWAQGEPALYETLDINEAYSPTIVADLNTPFAYCGDQGYDTVFFLETAEHLWNPFEALCSIASLLKSRGELFFSAPLINPIHDAVDYLRITGEWWEIAGKAAGFEINYIVARAATVGRVLLLEFFRAEGLRMSKIRYKVGDGHMIDHIGYYGRMIKGDQDEKPAGK